MTDRSAAMPKEADPLRELAYRCQDGDPNAQRELLTILQPRIRNLVRYLIRGDRDVDDYAQEAMVAVIRGLPSYAGRGTVVAWVNRITARKVFALLRKRSSDQEAPTAYLRAVPSGEARDPFLERRELVRALDTVSSDQRNALVLHHVLGMTAPEVAEELGVPLETARSRLRLGMAKLRTIMVAPQGDYT